LPAAASRAVAVAIHAGNVRALDVYSRLFLLAVRMHLELEFGQPPAFDDAANHGAIGRARLVHEDGPAGVAIDDAAISDAERSVTVRADDSVCDHPGDHRRGEPHANDQQLDGRHDPLLDRSAPRSTHVRPGRRITGRSMHFVRMLPEQPVGCPGPGGIGEKAEDRGEPLVGPPLPFY
jgi:hypothetical protein